MSTAFDPTPRPALRKAADAEVHPTTQVAAATTSDAILEGKLVPLDVKVPKKLRRQARRVAKKDGASLDQFVARAVANEVRQRTQ